MGLLDGGLATTEGLRDFSRAISNIRPANEVHAFRVGVCAGGDVSGCRPLRGLERRHIRRSKGIAVWPAYGSVRRVRPPDFKSHYIDWAIVGNVIGALLQFRFLGQCPHSRGSGCVVGTPSLTGLGKGSPVS